MSTTKICNEVRYYIQYIILQDVFDYRKYSNLDIYGIGAGYSDNRFQGMIFNQLRRVYEESK